MKIILMASRFPYPLEKGDKLRLYHAIRQLSLTHELHLVYHTDFGISDSHLKELNPYIKSYLPLKIKPIKKSILAIKSIFQTKIPLQVAWKYDKGLNRMIKNYADKIQPDVILCQLIRMSEYAKHLDYPKVIDYMDAFSESMKKRSRVVGFPLKYFYLREGVILSEYERQIKTSFDAYATISKKDATLLNLRYDKKTLVIPNGVDTQYFVNKNNKPSAAYDVGFVGNLSYLPNIHAVEFMYTNIYKNLSNLTFLISGADPAPRIHSLKSKNFNVTGWVDDIRESYQDIAIFVAPIFAGTGQQNKILEAMSMGIPCITTQAVNDSIEAKDGTEIIIANTSKEFIDSILMLRKDHNAMLGIGSKGRDFVMKKYTWDKHVNKLEKIFEIATYEYNRKRDNI